MGDFPTIFLSPDQVGPDGVEFDQKATRYLLSVLRLRSGAEVTACVDDLRYVVRLIEAGRGRLRGEIVRTLEPSTRTELDLSLGFCCVRPGPMEQILRHCTELGVNRFIPLLSSRTTRRPTDKKPRWDSIVATAAAQSGQHAVPHVEAPSDLHEFIHRTDCEGIKIMLTSHRDARPLLEVLEQMQGDSVRLLIGPEGGFDSSEEVQALECAFVPCSLGTAVLRTETAAIVATGIATCVHDWKTNPR